MATIQKKAVAHVDTSAHRELIETIKQKLEEASSLMDELASTPLEVKIEIERYERRTHERLHKSIRRNDLS